MSRFRDRRRKKRMSWESWVKIKDAESGRIYNGKLFNIHSTGIYFECDTPFDSGCELSVLIEKMPDTTRPDVIRAEVKWTEEIVAPVVMYHYGIGASLGHLAGRSGSKKGFEVIPGGMETIRDT